MDIGSQQIFDDCLYERALIDRSAVRIVVSHENLALPWRLGILIEVDDNLDGLIHFTPINDIENPLRQAGQILHVEGLGKPGDNSLLHGLIHAFLRRVHYKKMAHLSNAGQVDGDIDRHFKVEHFRFFLCCQFQPLKTVLPIDHAERPDCCRVNRDCISLRIKRYGFVCGE